MTEAWKAGDVAIIGRPNEDIAQLKGVACVLRSHHPGTKDDAGMWGVMLPSTGKTTSVFEHELERP